VASFGSEKSHKGINIKKRNSMESLLKPMLQKRLSISQK
jgi:hypothetical protein